MDTYRRRALTVTVAVATVVVVGVMSVAVAQPDGSGSGSGSGNGSGSGSGNGSGSDDGGGGPDVVGPVADAPVPPPIGIESDENDEFGPVIEVESVEIHGNRSTAERIIRRALSVVPGDVVRAGDARLRDARFKLLALGFFRDVTLSMRKGSERGKVVLVVDVVERGTIVLNRLWFGSSASSTAWFGADVGERNLFGTGLAVGGGLVYAGKGGIEGSRAQWAGELRISASALRGTRWGAFASLSALHGSEPYRIAGELDDDDDDNFATFDYRRLGGRVGASYDVTALMRVTAAFRAEVIDADLPVAPTRVDEDGTIVPVDLHLVPDRSRVMTLSVSLDRDTRPDPVLPHDGSRVRVGAELGASMLGGSYDFVTMLASYERWWPLREGRHAVGLKLAGGVIIGEAPRFDRIHLGDVNRMVTPRALGLVVSASGAPSFLGTRRNESPYGEVGGSAVVEYVAKLWRGGKHIYGGDLFIGAGLWTLADRDDYRVRAGAVRDALPLDLVIDAGLRVDTEIGIFELTMANALGRVPL
jgi:outer membrane protein insertion porin family